MAYTEDTLVQQTTAEYLERQLGTFFQELPKAGCVEDIEALLPWNFGDSLKQGSLTPHGGVR